MATTPRPLDLIVFGAAGFTGRLAAHYLAALPPGRFRWAIAARDPAKLSSLAAALAACANPPVEQLVVDHSDRAAVRAAVEKTRVALSFAGPFGLYGESLVAACAELGTHYLDITGETPWAARMIEAYEEQARRSGAILIPFSGFDSVPSDLGVWWLIEKTKAAGRPLTKVVGVFSGRGGLNGGTFATILDLFEKNESATLREPGLLIPAAARARFDFPDVMTPVRVPEEKLTAPPFFMSLINSRIVYRSQYLRSERLGEAALSFRYQELQRVPARFSRGTAWAIATGAQVFESIGKLRLGRAVLRRVGPKSGDGPSEQVRETGYFRARFLAYSGDDCLGRVEMSYPGDPGNKSTVLLACESALALIVDRPKLQAAINGGFWTPSTALGSTLYDRLVAAGVEFKSL